jgi:hypothetical protein
MTQIIVTIITGAVAIVTCRINSIYQASATRKLTEYKIEALEKKQDKHNSVIERVYHLEEEHAVMKEQIKVANHRIDDLEHTH